MCWMVIVQLSKFSQSVNTVLPTIYIVQAILPISITCDHLRRDHDQMIDAAYAKLIREPDNKHSL